MRPIFVYGIGRSGTSALLKAVGEHPDFDKFSARGEAPFIAEFIDFLNQFETQSPNKDYNVKNYKLDSEERSKVFARMMYQLHSASRGPDRARFWTSKISFNERIVGRMEELFPRFGVLYIVRNGIEVVNSSRNFHGFSSMDFEALCRRWNGSVRALRFAEERRDVAMMRHGDLVSDPHSVLQAAFQKLRVPHSDAPADFISSNIFNSSFSPTSSDTEKAVAGRTLSERQTEAWNSWSDSEQETFLSICEPEMRRLNFGIPGILEGGEWRQSPGPAQAARGPGAKGDKPGGKSVGKPAPKPKGKPRTIVATQYEAIESVTAKARAGSVVVPASVIKRRSLPTGESLRDALEARIGFGEASYCVHPALRAGAMYVEVPKVACTSIKYIVQSVEAEAAGETPREFDRHLVHKRTASPLPALRHMDDKEIESVLRGPDGPFRFTIVRDPYARVLSCYLSKIARRMPQRTQIIAALDGTDPSKTTDDGRDIDFQSFLEVVAAQSVRDMDIHWRPQVDQALIGIIPYDFIGRYESFQAAMGYVKHRAFPKSDVRMPAATNATGSSNKEGQYYDRRTIDLVRQIYVEDFKAFGYDPDRQNVG